MVKRKSNGFIFFADSRRSYYEAEVGRRLGPRNLVERAAIDWNRMSGNEHEMWKAESRRRQEARMDHHIHSIVLQPNQPRAKNRALSQLERELIERAKERGVDRHTARQTLTDKLLWREGGLLESLIDRRWAVVVLSDTGEGAVDEIVCCVIEKGQTLQEMRMRIKRASAESENEVRDVFWDPCNPVDVNAVSLQISKFLHGSWNNMILMPASQERRVASTFHWMKQTRDQITGRDTCSIRLDRLMCIEDVVRVFRQISGKPQVDSDADYHWDEMAEMEMTDTLFYARAACEYLIASLRKCFASPKPPQTDRLPEQMSSPDQIPARPSPPVQQKSSLRPDAPSFTPAGRMKQRDNLEALVRQFGLPPGLSPIPNYPQPPTGPSHQPTFTETFNNRKKMYPSMGGFRSNPFENSNNTECQTTAFENVTKWLNSISFNDMEKFSMEELSLGGEDGDYSTAIDT